MNGAMAPGAALSQVQLARRFGISRTPLREALRMLQEEGLITADRNQRARVAGLDPDELELIYASRILLSATATAVTVPRLDATDIAGLMSFSDAMHRAGEADDAEAWRRADRAFHRTHTRHAPATVLREIDQLFERASQYRLIWLRDQPHRQAMISADHAAILSACRARHPRAAAADVARHLSRIALTLMAYVAPEREATTIRAAVQMVVGGSADA